MLLSQSWLSTVVVLYWIFGNGYHCQHDDDIEEPRLPFCRKGHTAVRGFNGIDTFLVVFGGKGLNYQNSATPWLSDLWTLTLDMEDSQDIGFVWKQQFSPVPASSHDGWGRSVAQNGKGGLVVLGGGLDAQSSAYVKDLLYWLPSADQGQWIDMSSVPPVLSIPNGPGPRMGMSLVYLPRNDKFLALGGETLRTAAASPRKKNDVTCLSDTYLLNLNVILASIGELGSDTSNDGLDIGWWTRLSDLPGPCVTGAVAETVEMAGRECVAVFGGSRKGTGGTIFSSSLLVYDVEQNKWQEVGRPYLSTWEDSRSPPAWPQGRDRHAMAYVKSLNALYVFGGRGQGDPSTGDAFSVFADLWKFDLTTQAWQQLLGNRHGQLAQFQTPDARSLHSLTSYYGNRDKSTPMLVLFGGQLTAKVDIEEPPAPTYEPTPIPDDTQGSGHDLGVSRSRRSQSGKHSGGGDYHMLDDDEAWTWSDSTVHAQTNDVWVYFPASDVWQLVSCGGCHKGDSGELVRRNIDLSSLVVVGALACAGAAGIVAYKFLSKSKRDEGYESIPDSADSRHSFL